MVNTFTRSKKKKENVIEKFRSDSKQKKQEVKSTRKKVTDAVIGIIVLLFFLLWISGSLSRIGDSPPTNQPDYIKDVVAYKEGSYGLVIYFVLADKDGATTTSDGEATVTIIEENKDYYTNTVTVNQLFTKTTQVKAKDFYKTKLGQGAFSHESIIYNFGRVQYDEFSSKPTGSLGKVKVVFTTLDDKKLEGESTVFLD